MTRKSTITTLSALALVTSAGLLVAGPLNPPAGPVAPTYKTLAEVEPRTAINLTNTPGDVDSVFKITQPGSYYLTGNIQGIANKHGIEVVASGVTIDLSGFELAGVAGMGAFDGISVTVVGLTNLSVVNGSVRNWGDDGVDLASLTPHGCRVAGVQASGNAGDGIRTPTASAVSHCSAYFNSGIGIVIANGAISHCATHANSGNGINLGTGATATNCTSFDNGGIGINAGLGCSLTNCSVSGNTLGGITASSGSTVTDSSAYANDGIGITVGHGSTVADCTARANILDGIVCTTACVIRSNTCSNNGSGGDGAGIEASGSDNRIEGNNCSGADRGLDVDSAGNFITRNTCTGNTNNFAISAAGNICYVVQAAASGLILGNSGGVPPGSSDPNANFSY